MRFLLLGNGGGGTSLLRGLLNAHPEIECLFENKGGTGERTPKDELDHWLWLAAESGYTWGNKIPVEQFWHRNWKDLEIINLINHFHIVYLIRRFSKYKKPKVLNFNYEKNWQWSSSLYWAMRERRPEKIIMVSFEDLLLRPKTELYRICEFLKVKMDYDNILEMMLQGTNDTGFRKYNQGGLNLDKI